MAATMRDALSNTTNTSTSFMEGTSTPKPDYSQIRFGYFVCTGVIIPLGFIFNTLSMVVLLSSRCLRNSTTGLYLIALALADNLYLFGELLRWLDTDTHVESYVFLSMSDAACQFVFSLRYGAKLTSTWITVAITMERFLIVTFPLKAATLCTRKVAKIVIFVTYVVCFALGCFPIISVGLDTWNGQQECLVTNPAVYHAGNWAVLRVGSLIVPGLTVIVLTCLIILNLSRAKMLRRRTLNEARSTRSSRAMNPGTEAGNARSTNRGVERQLTAMLLAVAIAFIALRIPYTILYYINEYKEELWNPLDGYFSHRIYTVTKIADLFANINYAINFFLYCLTGGTFRHQLRVLFGCEGSSSGRRYSTSSAITHRTSLHNDKIQLSIIRKPNNQPSPPLKR